MYFNFHALGGKTNKYYYLNRNFVEDHGKISLIAIFYFMKWLIYIF